MSGNTTNTTTTDTTPEDVALLGGSDGATLGPPFAGYMGPARAPGYRLEITTGEGDRITLSEFISLSVTRRHTALSNWAATIPMRQGIDDRTLSEIRLTWGDTILFRGRFEDVSGDLYAPVVGISGRGIAADLTRGSIGLNAENVRYIDVIRRVWRQKTDFSATVIEPTDPDHQAFTRVDFSSDDGGDGGDYSGTPMEVLQQLHEDAGMRFTVLHSRPGLNVESYPIGARRRRYDWTVLGGSRDTSAKGYANRVVLEGEYRSDGTRLRVVVEDKSEIAAMRQRGIGDDGRVTYPIDKPEITDRAKARAKAKSKLAELVEKDTVGGSLDVSPTIAAPGYAYYIEEFAGRETALRYGEGRYGEGTYGDIPGRYVSLNQTSYQISRGEESCSLDFSQREGLAGVLENKYGDSL